MTWLSVGVISIKGLLFEAMEAEMGASLNSMMDLLVRRGIFASEEEAIRELLRDYVLRQISKLRRETARFERKYGMNFQQFGEYLHERSLLLDKGDLSPEQRGVLGKAIMQEEDDWVDWKVAREMLESWLGFKREMDV